MQGKAKLSEEVEVASRGVSIVPGGGKECWRGLVNRSTAEHDLSRIR